MPKSTAVDSTNEVGQRMYTTWRVHGQRGHPSFPSEAAARAYADDPANGAFRIDEETTTVIWEVMVDATCEP